MKINIPNPADAQQRLTRLVEQWDREAAEVASAAQANLEGGYPLTESQIEALAIVTARAPVAWQVRAALEATSDEWDAMAGRLADSAMRYALSTHHANSTSNIAVEVKIYAREAWATVAGILIDETGIAL